MAVSILDNSADLFAGSLKAVRFSGSTSERCMGGPRGRRLSSQCFSTAVFPNAMDTGVTGFLASILTLLP
jgi:hypothetical protein